MSGRTVTGRMLPSYCSERQEPIEEAPTLQGNQRAALMGLARDLAVAPRPSLSRLLEDDTGICR
jgi:hypothetical protein